MNFMPYLLLLVVVITSYIFLNSISTKVNELNYTELTTEINSGKVTELNVTPKNSSGVYELTGKMNGYKKGEIFKVTVPYTDTVISSIYETAEQHNLKVTTNTNPENSTWINVLFNVVPIIVFGILIYVMFIKLGNNGKGTFDFGKSKAKLSEDGGTKTFKDVAGLKEEKEEKEEKKMERTMKVEGMMCGHCEAHVKKALEALEGVTGAVASHEKGTVQVSLAPDASVTEEELKKAVEAEGYQVKEIL